MNGLWGPSRLGLCGSRDRFLLMTCPGLDLGTVAKRVKTCGRALFILRADHYMTHLC